MRCVGVGGEQERGEELESERVGPLEGMDHQIQSFMSQVCTK